MAKRNLYMITWFSNEEMETIRVFYSSLKKAKQRLVELNKDRDVQFIELYKLLN